MRTKFFEDLSERDRLQCEPVFMTKESIIKFANQFDPQLFHIDENAANNSIFNGLVASILSSASFCMYSGCC